MTGPIITNDAIVLGMLVAVVGLVFYTRSLGGGWTRFYTFVPALLLCYLIPSLMNSFGLISSQESNLRDVSSLDLRRRYPKAVESLLGQFNVGKIHFLWKCLDLCRRLLGRFCFRFRIRATPSQGE